MASPYVISADEGVASPDSFFGLITSNDLGVGELVVGNAGYTVVNTGFDKSGGGLTVNQNLITLDVGESFIFSVRAIQITVDYALQITIYVSNLDCTEKFRALGSMAITITESGDPVNLEPPGSWATLSVGTDLVFEDDGDSVLVTSIAGGCYAAQMVLDWVAV